MTPARTNSVLTEIPRDVLRMLEVELRNARAGYTADAQGSSPAKSDGYNEFSPNDDGIDLDFCEMLEETIAEIKRLRRIVGDG